MKALWFSASCGYVPPSQLVSATTRGGYNGGGWMPSLLNEVKKRAEIELGVCFAMDGQPFKSVQNGVSYYPFPNHTKCYKDKILDIFKYRDVKRDEVVWQHYKDCFKKVVEDFKPDVIHLFGSELYLGLVTFVAPCPVVVHIQGLLSLYIYIWFPSGVSKTSYLFQDWNLKRIYDRFQLYVYWRRGCYREQQVLKQTKHVIGRTDWDYSATKIMNPDRVYHYGSEILRPEFYMDSQRHIPDKLTIVTTSSNAIYKGFDYVLDIADILKNKMGIDFEWLVYGNVNPAFFEKKTGVNHHDVNVKLMGVASAATLRDAISNATLYFQPSYIENSPNSVCEAQILGVPVIATNVGGTSSLIEEGKTGFLVPTNDPYTAAYRISQVADDKELNQQVGKRAREIALKRHDRQRIVEELIATYHEVYSDSK
ncbi:MAG: glycosyltransferase [Prevotella sp.]|nr:glycosyltransferase [Prevotella sp.]